MLPDKLFVVLDVGPPGHSGVLLLQFFAVGETAQLRLTCRALLKKLHRFQWPLWPPPHVRPDRLHVWRLVFPFAVSVRVRIGPRIPGLTDACLRFLSGSRGQRRPLEHLDVSMQKGLSSAAFKDLTSLTFLRINGCSQPTLGDAAFLGLRNLEHLDMRGCSQFTISSAAFQQLSSLTYLNITGCTQLSLGDAALRGLCKLEQLVMSRCDQPTFTSAVFANLIKLQHLSITDCTQETLGDTALLGLPRLQTLQMSGCHQPSFTSAAFANFGRLPGVHGSGGCCVARLHPRSHPSRPCVRVDSCFAESRVAGAQANLRTRGQNCCHRDHPAGLMNVISARRSRRAGTVLIGACIHCIIFFFETC